MRPTHRLLAAGAVLVVAACSADSQATPTLASTSTTHPSVPATTRATTTTTPPVATTTTVTADNSRYVVVGDFGDGGPAEYEVAEAIETLTADTRIQALITTGDNFYNNDVESIWATPYGWLEETGIPVYAAWGNHDIDSTTRRQLVEEVLDPPGRWYSRDLGLGTLVVLDSNDVGNEEQADWLARTLPASADPIIVVFHHPAFSCGLHGNSGSIIDRWVPLFQENGVALVLSGHDHNYERLEREGVTYVITGGGGRPIRPGRPFCPKGNPEVAESDHEHNHFVVLELGAGGIQGAALAPDGVTLDSWYVGP